MKLYQKICILGFLVMLPLFAVFGNIMIYVSFQSGMKAEIKEGYSDQRAFHTAFESLLSGIYQVEPKEEYLTAITDKIQESILDSEFVLIREDGTALGFEDSYICEELFRLVRGGKRRIAYTVIREQNHHSLIYMSCINIKNSCFYIQSRKEINKPYAERKLSYQTYFISLFFLMLLGGSFLSLAAKYTTRNLERLGEAACRFSEGDYSIRLKSSSNDEIGRLTQDFNYMAGQLEKTIDELKKSVKRQEDFTAAFSHELKTPMTSIIGYADMLRSMRLNEREVVEYADYIFTQGKRLESLSKNMLLLFEIVQNETPMSSLSIEQIVKKSVQSIESAMNQAGICCRTEVCSGRIMGNESLLISLLVNLLDNAKKASKEGGLIEISGFADKQNYVLKICDWGCGIPKEDISRITEPFYMADKSRDRKKGGTGLGLSLAKNIVRIHHADMHIKSQLGEGTEIELRFLLEMEGEENENK